MRALIFSERSGDRFLAARTRRALRRLKIAADDSTFADPISLAAQLRQSSGPIWLLRAGAWLTHRDSPSLPPPSSTGKPLLGVGAVTANVDDGCWSDHLARTGGDFTARKHSSLDRPELASVYLEPRAAEIVGRHLLQAHGSVADAIWSVVGAHGVRALHLAAFDVCDDPHVRILQVVTSLQRGGAERLALDLAELLEKRGHFCPVVTLGRPTRSAFPTPADWLDLATLRDRAERADAIGEIVAADGIDLIHGHLIDRPDIVLLSRLELPLVLTIHNTRPGWPEGLGELKAGDATLLVGCANAVEAELRGAGIPIPLRTVWNGIDFMALTRTPERLAAAAALRAAHGVAPADFVLLALANPRPQKRLHLLPGILTATQARLPGRTVHLFLAGQAAAVDPRAQECVRQIHAEIQRHQVVERVTWLGPVADVAPVLLASDALASVSAHEGLSLAQLEALAAGIAIVATDVGGAAEIARDNPACTSVPIDAPADEYANRLARIATAPPPSGRDEAARCFTREQMSGRYEFLYRRALETAHRPHGTGLWLITNNFSTGGAQSSARRLLLGLATEGVRVRATTLEEQPSCPTPGLQALIDAGISVDAVPPGGAVDAGVCELLERMDAAPPQAVLFWNALPEYKLRLADALIGTRLFDVSPGAMFFDSLDRYFARPRPGFPYRCPAEYGRRLTGVIVKYHAERERAARLDAPVHVIPNGVPLPAPSPPRPTCDSLVIGTLARINPQKKLEELLAALRLAHDRLPPYVLHIAGGVERGCGDYASSLRKLANGLNVAWVGECESCAFLQGLDIFALIGEPAGCPNASLEAMACGLPLIATDVGGMSEQVSDGQTGRLVPRGDNQQLAAALIELACHPQKRRAWGLAGRQRLEGQFSVARMVADYRRVCLGG